MRASLRGRHVSGGETLVPVGRREKRAIAALLGRLAWRGPAADRIVITRERVKSRTLCLPVLAVESLAVSSPSEGLALMGSLLLEAGVSEEAARRGMAHIRWSAIPGAALFDARTGRRLDPDCARGVRVTRVGWEAGARREQARRLARRGIRHARTIEALALATKIAASGAVAEVCRSDDRAYLTGYVSSRRLGYVRVTPVRRDGEPGGGRAIFVRSGAVLDRLASFLMSKPVLVSSSRSMEAE